jgi:hypothetical protein
MFGVRVVSSLGGRCGRWPRWGAALSGWWPGGPDGQAKGKDGARQSGVEPPHSKAATADERG